jgi:enoyl-CoA hydratase/carnithine racemase
LACDVRFVASDAKIGFAFVRRGVLAGFAAHTTLARVVGLSNAAELLFSGRTLSGTDAASLGLASQALPAPEVLPAALRLAREIAQHAAPVAVALSKQLLWSELDPGRVKAREDRCFAWAGNQPDAREGVAAFLEKRLPAWTGSPNRSGEIARILGRE